MKAHYQVVYQFEFFNTLILKGNFMMKTKKESSLKMAVKLVTATKGNANTASIVKEVFEEIQKIRKDQAQSFGSTFFKESI